jgi:hypothetical protein
MKTKFMPIGAVYLKEMSVMGYWLLLFMMNREEELGEDHNGEHTIQIHLNEFLGFLKTEKIVLGEGFEYKKFIDECFASEVAVITGDGHGMKKRVYKIFKEIRFKGKSGTALIMLNEEVKKWVPFIVRNGIPGFSLCDTRRSRGEAVRKEKNIWRKLYAFFTGKKLGKLIVEEKMLEREKPEENTLKDKRRKEKSRREISRREKCRKRMRVVVVMHNNSVSTTCINST